MLIDVQFNALIIDFGCIDGAGKTSVCVAEQPGSVDGETDVYVAFRFLYDVAIFTRIPKNGVYCTRGIDNTETVFVIPTFGG